MATAGDAFPNVYPQPSLPSTPSQGGEFSVFCRLSPVQHPRVRIFLPHSAQAPTKPLRRAVRGCNDLEVRRAVELLRSEPAQLSLGDFAGPAPTAAAFFHRA